jgi:hypothetical protein
LHVLSTPPAFVLSQDQTLQFKNLKKSILALFTTLAIVLNPQNIFNAQISKN